MSQSVPGKDDSQPASNASGEYAISPELATVLDSCIEELLRGNGAQVQAAARAEYPLSQQSLPNDALRLWAATNSEHRLGFSEELQRAYFWLEFGINAPQMGNDGLSCILDIGRHPEDKLTTIFTVRTHDSRDAVRLLWLSRSPDGWHVHGRSQSLSATDLLGEVDLDALKAIVDNPAAEPLAADSARVIIAARSLINERLS